MKKIILDSNPVTQITLCLLFAISSVLFGYYFTAILVAAMIIIAFAVGRGTSFLKMWLKTIFFVSAFVFIMQMFFYPGQTFLWKMWVFKITSEGINKGIELGTRILGVGTAIGFGIKIVDLKRLVVALEERGIPRSATYIIMSTVNIIPQMSKKMKTIMDAQKARGVETESNILVRAKAFFPTVGPLILSSIVSAEERTITLEARAFSAKVKKTRINEVIDTKADKVGRKIILAILILEIIGRIVLWIV